MSYSCHQTLFNTVSDGPILIGNAFHALSNLEDKEVCLEMLSMGFKFNLEEEDICLPYDGMSLPY